MRQSSEALPHDITELKMALTIKLLVLLYTKYIAAEQHPAENVANTAKKKMHCYTPLYILKVKKIILSLKH